MVTRNSAETAPPREKTAIQVIERMMNLLDALSAHTDPVSLKELSKATQLHPSTAHRILNDMVVGRFVDRGDQAGTYRLGMRLLELGNLVKARLSVREAALEPMRDLHRKTGQTVNLSVRQGDEIVYVERAYSERSGMQVVRAIGGRAALHLTSSGKLFLAHDDTRLVRAYATRSGLAGHTRNSITDLPRLERELSMVRATTRNSKSESVASPPVYATIPDDWSPGFLSQRPRNACRTTGSRIFSVLQGPFRPAWGMAVPTRVARRE
jgi:DNA-binding IclR family transcriptional regulator